MMEFPAASRTTWLAVAAILIVVFGAFILTQSAPASAPSATVSGASAAPASAESFSAGDAKVTVTRTVSTGPDGKTVQSYSFVSDRDAVVEIIYNVPKDDYATASEFKAANPDFADATTLIEDPKLSKIVSLQSGQPVRQAVRGGPLDVLVRLAPAASASSSPAPTSDASASDSASLQGNPVLVSTSAMLGMASIEFPLSQADAALVLGSLGDGSKVAFSIFSTDDPEYRVPIDGITGRTASCSPDHACVVLDFSPLFSQKDQGYFYVDHSFDVQVAFPGVLKDDQTFTLEADGLTFAHFDDAGQVPLTYLFQKDASKKDVWQVRNTPYAFQDFAKTLDVSVLADADVDARVSSVPVLENGIERPAPLPETYQGGTLATVSLPAVYQGNPVPSSCEDYYCTCDDLQKAAQAGVYAFRSDVQGIFLRPDGTPNAAAVALFRQKYPDEVPTYRMLVRGQNLDQCSLALDGPALSPSDSAAMNGRTSLLTFTYDLSTPAASDAYSASVAKLPAAAADYVGRVLYTSAGPKPLAADDFQKALDRMDAGLADQIREP